MVYFTMNDNVLLRLENISKSFYGTQVLHDICFEVRQGEVHALLGENGAGKSTLLNILTGVFIPDSGNIYLDNREIEINNPSVANKLGINKVHQELQLIPELTVGQNIFLGHEPKGILPGLIQWGDMYRKSNDVLRRLDADFSSKEKVKNLSTAQMQMVEIAKALQLESRILALDEPTSSLTDVEINKLFEIIKLLRKNGTAIIYVSHRLEEVFQIADRMTILRDGNYIGTYGIKELDKPKLIKLMVGRELNDVMRSDRQRTSGEVVLEIRNLVLQKSKNKINFCLRKGEILGIAGLVGSGRTELVRAIFGADKARKGEIYLHGKRISIKSPSDAINHGIALIPEDRKRQGFVSILSNKSNICLPSLTNLRTGGLINHKKMANIANKSVMSLKITPQKIDKPTREMSGGNQQKIVLAKWLSKNSEIMIFDEPTRGVDVGAKSEIYKLMHDLADQGNSIIMVSSELPEILGMSDRVLVMHEGSINGEIFAQEATEEKILHFAMGGN